MLHTAGLKMTPKQSERSNHCTRVFGNKLGNLGNKISPIKLFHKHDVSKHDVSDQFCEEKGDHWCGESSDETANVGRTNACIHCSFVCDSNQDCRDNSDENDCPLVIDEDTMFMVVPVEW